MRYPGYIIHYASEYYDPVKAHEYYEQHKELKGNSSVRLNDEGKNVLNYVKKQINDEKDRKLEAETTSKKTKLDSLKSNKETSVETYANQVNEKISSLRNSLKGLTKEQKAEKKDEVYEEIAKLRADNKAKRSEILAQYSSDRTDVNDTSRTTKQNIRTDAKNKIAEETDKIKSESKYQYQKKSTSKSNSVTTATPAKKTTKNTATTKKQNNQPTNYYMQKYMGK